MSPGRSRSESPFSGDPLADPSLEKPLSALKALAGSQFDVLGPLGRDAEGEYAFLAREVSRNRLVVLKRQRAFPPQAADPGALEVITQLDSSVPPPAGSCPACQTSFSNWEPLCPECGANVAGSVNVAPGTPPEKVLAAIRKVAEGYEVFGTMQRAVGGALVYFARDLSGGHLVALRLEDDETETGQAGYSLTANRMMRPKLLYGTVAGETSRAGGNSPGDGGWTPVPSPARGGVERSLPPERVCPQCGQTFGPELRLCPRDGSALRPVAVPDGLIGRVIADRYHIVDRLGQGGMGTVYLAEHIRMGRRCAVKLMNPNLLNDPDSLDRFTREAKNASLLNHPHVAGVYDFGETADGIVYLAMEFVEGESLASVLTRQGAIPEQRALELGRQVADALSAAHELGIVHRDLKPDNIMICQPKPGQLLVKVVDFGIAKATQGTHQTVTRTGYVLGTPAYMSPEQILGDPLDGRSDLYSLGCILFEMLTGQRAFAGPSGEVSMRRRLTEPPPHLRSVKHALSKSLDEIVTKAMARSPEQRFQSAAELREALQAALGERPQRAKRRGWLRRGQSEPAAAVDDEPLISRTPTPTPRASLLSPAPFAAAVQSENDASLSVQPDWVAETQPVSPLRHRSARNEVPRAGRMVGVLVAVGLIGAVAVYAGTSGNLAKYRLLVSDFVRSIPSSVSSKSSVGPVSLGEPLPLPTEDSAATKSSSGDQGPVPAAAFIRFAKLNPADARVIVDNVEMRPGSDSLVKIAPGSHVVVVRASGYRRSTRTISATAGDTSSLEVELVQSQAKPAPQADTPIDSTMGAIVLNGTLPAGAELRVDGNVTTPASGVLTITPGSHWISISVPGYGADSSEVNVEQGGRSDWTIPTLAVSSDTNAATDTSAGTVVDSAPAAATQPSAVDSSTSSAAAEPSAADSAASPSAAEPSAAPPAVADSVPTPQ
jgi:serine/threonine protein kinase